MMKNIFITVMVIALGMTLLGIGGCGYKEGTTIPDQNAYIWFSGKTEGVTAYIDESAPIDLAPGYYTDATGTKRARTTDVHYKIEPGKHTIKLVRAGQVILERVVLIGNHMTKEIEIP